MRSKVSSRRRQRLPAENSKCNASLSSPSINSNTIINTLVDGVTGRVNGIVSPKALPQLDALLELDEMYSDEFSQALKAGDFSDLVMIYPEVG